MHDDNSSGTFRGNTVPTYRRKAPGKHYVTLLYVYFKSKKPCLTTKFTGKQILDDVVQKTPLGYLSRKIGNCDLATSYQTISCRPKFPDRE